MPLPGLAATVRLAFAWDVVVGRVRTDPFALASDAAVIVAGVAYLAYARAQVRAVPSGDVDRWRGLRTLSFAGGLVVLFAALGSGLALYQYSSPPVDVVQHVLVMMVAPPLLVLGCAGTRRGPRSVPGLAGRVLRRVSGVVSWPLYYGSMAAYFLSPAYGRSLREPVLLDGVEVAFVVVGLLFWVGLVGTDRTGRPRSHAFRMVGVICGMPIETAVGLVLVVWPHPMAPGVSVPATHAAGMLLWLGCMLTSGVALAVLLVQWGIHDTRRTDEEVALVESRAGSGGPDVRAARS